MPNAPAPPASAKRTLVDVPILLGVASVDWLAEFRRILPSSLVVSQNAPAELREAWLAGAPGSDRIDPDELTVLAPAGSGNANELITAGQAWRALGTAWRRPGERRHRSDSLAAALVAAVNLGVPLLSHDPRA